MSFKGKVPPAYNVDHQVALSAGGADSPLNMRLKDIATHKIRHNVLSAMGVAS